MPLGQTEYFEYDPDTLRLIQHTDFEGNITERVYSDFGFLDELRYYEPGSDPDLDPADEVVAFAYNDLDQRETVTDSRGDTDFAYDAFDRLAQLVCASCRSSSPSTSSRAEARTKPLCGIGDPPNPTREWTYTYDISWVTASRVQVRSRILHIEGLRPI